jgi:uncharacterized protein
MDEFSGVFNERSAVLALFGALGGVVRAAALKTTWRDGLRVSFIGCATAFGVGTTAPALMAWAGIAEIPSDAAAPLGTLCAGAFMTGLVAVTLIERFIEGRKAKEGDGNE